LDTKLIASSLHWFLRNLAGVSQGPNRRYIFQKLEVRIRAGANTSSDGLRADYGGRWFKGSQRFHHAACLPFDPLIESDPGAIPRAACGDAGGFIKKASQLNRCSEKFLS